MGGTKAAETRSRREQQSGLRQHGGASMGDAVSGGASGSGSHPLWRKSSQPFCSSLGSSVGSLHVWSDARGAFVLASLDGEAKLPTVSTKHFDQYRIRLEHDVTWSGYDFDRALGLKGFVNGPLVAYLGPSCPIGSLMEELLRAAARNPSTMWPS